MPIQQRPGTNPAPAAISSQRRDSAATLADLLLATQDQALANAPCITQVSINLLRAVAHDLSVADAQTHAIQTLRDIQQGNLDGSAAYEIVGYGDIAAANLFAKLKALFDFLDSFAPGGACSGSLSQVVAAAQAALPALQDDLAILNLAMSAVANVPTHGYDLLGTTTITGLNGVPITIVVNPNETPGGAPGVPSNNNISIPPPPPANESPPNCPSFQLSPGTNCQFSGGFGSSLNGLPGGVFMGSQVTKVGSFTTDPSGAFSTNITIPSQVVAGAHELYAVAGGPNGVKVLASEINVNRTGSPLRPPCIGTLNGVTINGSLTVQPGMVCALINSRVNGTVTIDQGAVFEADASRLNGGVVANSPESLALCGDQVNGTVTGANSSSLPPLIGDANSAPSCEPTKITGG